jgi:TolB-like protein/Tfp pilus assembly protein PilF
MDTFGEFVTELRRRRVLSNAALYIIAAWVTIQVAGEAIDAGLVRIPQRDVFVAAFLGFPVALVVSWFYDITRQGLVRTPAADADESFDPSLRLRDYGLLSALAVVWLIGVFLIHTPAAVEKSIAILPFENPGRDPDNEMFAYGIRVDLQTQLQKLNDLKIVARESSDRVNTSMPLSQIGLNLGAAYIMRGTVERAFDQVRISVILVHAETETQALAANFDRDLSARNWFDIRNEITDNIVRTLRAELSPEEQRQIRTEPTQSLAAMNAYGQGMRRKGKRTVGSLAEAIESFRTAIELDPEFALAYVGLADSVYLHQLYSQAPLDEVIPIMKEAVDKSIAIDDELGEAYVTRAVIERIDNGDTIAAETYFTRALDLSPNYPVAHQWYGAFLSSTGRREQGLASKRRALALDPQSAHLAFEVGITLMSMGRNDEALEQFEGAIALDPAVPGPYERTADIHRSRGRLAEAARWQHKGVALDPDDPMARIFLGLIYLDLGDTDAAEEWFDRAAGLMPREFPLADGMKESLLLRRGDVEGALEYARTNIVFAPSGRHTLANLRDHDLRSGNFDEALARYEVAFPELLTEKPPVVNEDNVQIAIDIAPILLRMGQLERGNQFLDISLEVISAAAFPGDLIDFGIHRVTIYALQGNTDAALATLQRTIDAGWRDRWWLSLELDSSLDSIRDEPEFQSMLQVIRDDMASQLARLEELEALGQLDPMSGSD